MAAKTIVILGAGIGGIVAAHALQKKLGKRHKIVLIDKDGRYSFSPSYPWVAIGQREPDQIIRDRITLKRKGIQFVRAAVSKIDVEKRLVGVDGTEIVYDYLIVALGAELNPMGLRGFSETAQTFYELGGATDLRKVLERFSSGRVALLVSSMPYKCPAGPYEGAFLLDYLFRTRGIRDRVQMELYTPEPQPMPVAGKEVGNAIEDLLKSRNVSFFPDHQATAIDPQKREIIFGDGKTAGFDLLIGVPPHQSPAVVREAGLTGESGWIPVDSKNLSTEHSGVFALGDVASVQMPVGKPLPKAGVFAHAEAEIIAHNIASEINGTEAQKEFDGRGSCFLEIGGGKAGFAKGQFFAPQPEVDLKRPARRWHWAKALYERYFLWRWF